MLNMFAESEAHVFSDSAARYDSLKFMPTFLENHRHQCVRNVIQAKLALPEALTLIPLLPFWDRAIDR